MTLTERLIECVKSNPILHDFKHPEYKNIRMRDKVWIEIGKKLNENSDEVKKKWKNIKDCYLKYLKTVNTKEGQIVKRSYKNWQWAPQMDFFKPQTEISTKNSENNSTSKSEHERIYHSPVEADEESRHNMIEENTQTKRTIIYNKHKRRMKSHLAVSSRNFRHPKRQQIFPSDATDLIFLGYSNTIKNFSPTRQAIVKMRIAQIIMEEELKNLEETSAVPATNSFSEYQEMSPTDDNQLISSKIEFSIKSDLDDSY